MNRERIALAITAVIAVFGGYRVVTGFLSPTSGVRVLDLRIPLVHREIIKPEYRRHSPELGQLRDPFNVSEGWQRLDALPLGPPPLPAMSWLLPPLARSPSPDVGGILWREIEPSEIAETEAGGDAGDAAGGARGTSAGTGAVGGTEKP